MIDAGLTHPERHWKAVRITEYQSTLKVSSTAGVVPIGEWIVEDLWGGGEVGQDVGVDELVCVGVAYVAESHVGWNLPGQRHLGLVDIVLRGTCRWCPIDADGASG